MFNYFLFSSLLLTLALGDDPLAQAKCRSLHSTDVDSSGTAYANDKCLLTCSIHGKVWTHNMSEGLPCPALLGTHNVCTGGHCLAPIQLGYIDIEMASAQLSKSAMTFADVCIQNASTTVSLPIVDRKSCVSCKTKTVSPTTSPIYSAICTGSHNFLWVNNSRVTFEIWEPSGSKQNFGGGASVLVSQIVSSGDNHKQISLPLANGDNSGKITVRVTWTPK